MSVNSTQPIQPATAAGASAARTLTSPSRLDSIDIVRGLIIVFMVVDHTRDYFTDQRINPEVLSYTYYAVFFTRWITHFCAPMFFFLAGTAVYLYGTRRTPAEVSRFLWTRGLWLIVVEFTIVGFGWTFVFPFGFFGVIWALGASMVIMAAAVRMPIRWLGALSVMVVVLHDLLDRIRPTQFGSAAWVWSILHVKGVVQFPGHISSLVQHPLIPCVALMGAGYVFGALYQRDQSERRRVMIRLGLAMIVAFVLLRLTNLYGNPPAGFGGVSQGDWHLQPTVEKTLILFLDVEKYPPSLQFLLMTLGPGILLLGLLDGKTASRIFRPLVVFGRVPMFFYILHLYVVHCLAIVVAILLHQPYQWLLHGAFMQNVTPVGYGHGLPFIYLMSLTVLVIMYFPCRWFMGVKQRRKDWWLSYL